MATEYHEISKYLSGNIMGKNWCCVQIIFNETAYALKTPRVVFLSHPAACPMSMGNAKEAQHLKWLITSFFW